LVNALPVGGTERILLRLLPALQAAGADVSLITLKREAALDGAMRTSGVPVQSIGIEGVRSAHRLWRLRRVLAEMRPDILHTHLFFADTAGAMASVGQASLRIVSTQHNDGYWMQSAHRFLEAMLRSRRVRTIAISEAVRRAMIKRGESPARIDVLPHSTVSLSDIDFEIADGAATNLSESSSTRVGATDRRICVVGRLVPVKGTEDVILAAARLSERFPNVVVQIIGDGPERRRLESLRDRLGLRGCVHFLGQRDDVRVMIRRADALVSTSRAEGLSMSILEAMSCGRPVVATRVGGVPELVEDGVSGFLVPPGDVSALSAGVERILESPELALRLGAQGRAACRTRWNVEAMVDAHIELYRRVLG